MAELAAKHLLFNLSFGVLDGTKFRSRFGVSLLDLYEPQLSYAVNAGWLAERRARGTDTDSSFLITPGSYRFMPELRALFYSTEALAWSSEQSKLQSTDRHVPIQKVSFTRPCVGREEVQAVAEVLQSGRLIMGPKIREFERLLAEYTRREHCVAVTSGTAALTVALSAIGVTQE